MNLGLDPYLGFEEALFNEFDPEVAFNIEEDLTEFEYTEKASLQGVIDGIKKIWYMIKKFVKMIIYHISVFFQKKSKTANQIAKELKMKEREYNLTDAKELNNEAAESLYTSFIEEIKDNKIVINPFKLVLAGDRNAKIKGKNVFAGGERAMAVVECINDPTILDEYITFMKRLLLDGNTVKKSDIKRISKVCQNFVDRPSNAAYFNSWRHNLIGNQAKMALEFKKVELRMEDLVMFQKKVDELCELNEAFDKHMNDLNVSFGKSKDYEIEDLMKTLNDLSWVCVNLQGGLNAICNGLKQIYRIGKEYYNTVNEPESLAKFVAACLKTGIPVKYIVHNIYKVCTREMKGYQDPDEPLMGFGRLTLIPTDKDIVYKIAINGYGIRSNKNDFIVMDEIKRINSEYLTSKFAHTTEQYENYTINVMDKVKAGAKNQPSGKEARKIAAEINREFQKNGARFKIGDIKPDGFGKNKFHDYVIIDYGYLVRTAV